jgi:hypothetical protein
MSLFQGKSSVPLERKASAPAVTAAAAVDAKAIDWADVKLLLAAEQFGAAKLRPLLHQRIRVTALNVVELAAFANKQDSHWLRVSPPPRSFSRCESQRLLLPWQVLCFSFIQADCARCPESVQRPGLSSCRPLRSRSCATGLPTFARSSRFHGGGRDPLDRPQRVGYAQEDPVAAV